jgi:hypothetical protein
MAVAMQKEVHATAAKALASAVARTSSVLGIIVLFAPLPE